MLVEQPQLRVTIDGLAVPGATSMEVESLGYFAADRFRVEFAIGAGALTTTSFFAAMEMQTISIEVALGAGGFVTLLLGQVDNVRVDLLENVATVSGRDLSARLIDAEILETFVNQTSSQIAQAIAARHGLGANVTVTRTAVGQYYELDHARSALGLNARTTTEWNLLVGLAQIEDFALSVTGEILNFMPVAAQTPVFLGLSNLMTLTMDSATTLPRQTVVRSWNCRNKMAVMQSAGNGMGSTTTVVRPNLTAAQAGVIAENHLAALARHTTVLTATMPGELALAPNAEVVLGGTNSAFDQSYVVDAISRSVNWRTGFTQTIRAHAISG